MNAWDGDRLALLLPDLRAGGAERVTLTLAEEFVRRDYLVDIVVMRAQGDLLEAARQIARVVDLDAERFRNLFAPLVRHFRVERPSAVVANMWPLTALAPVALSLSGIRCTSVIAEHNSLSIQYAPRGWTHRVAMRSSMALGYRFADARTEGIHPFGRLG